MFKFSKTAKVKVLNPHGATAHKRSIFKEVLSKFRKSPIKIAIKKPIKNLIKFT